MSRIKKYHQRNKKYEDRNSQRANAEAANEGQGNSSAAGNEQAPHGESAAIEAARQNRFREAGDKLVEKAREFNKGNKEKSRGMIGLFPTLTLKVADAVVLFLAKLVRQGWIISF